jgi:hypothetical protein
MKIPEEGYLLRVFVGEATGLGRRHYVQISGGKLRERKHPS